MGYEIDFLAVGDGSRSGDAIALRYGNLFGRRDEQVVVIIDGGDCDAGERLVSHVRTYYKAKDVNYVISTHPDCDHVSGLKVVVEQLKVGTLLMHRPWDHAHEIRQTFRDSRFTPTGLASKLEKALAAASDLEDAARSRSIPIYEPFAGTRTPDGRLLILGPTKDYYQSLVCKFDRTPAAAKLPDSWIADALRNYSRTGAASNIFTSASSGTTGLASLFGTARTASSTPSLGLFAGVARERDNLVSAYLGTTEAPRSVIGTALMDSLRGANDTSAQNNSSAILLLSVDGQRVLFTGDAGVGALTAAASYAASVGLSLTGLDGWQVPHHGSRHNVNSAVLDLIGGPFAFISAAVAGKPDHPSSNVTNALIRRGTQVFGTCGLNLWHRRDAPERSGYKAADPVPFDFDTSD